MARQYEREEMNPFMDLELKWGAEDALANVMDKQSPAPAQVASAEPQSVSESDNLLDTAYRALGYKSGMGKYKDIEVGASPAHPLLSQFGMVDNQREQKIQELMEAQAHIRDMVLKASKKKIDNLINPKDISDPNVPAGIKPTMDQTMAGFQKPTFDLPDVSTPQSSPLYPENQTLPQPRGPMNDLQEALMASVIAGHLTPNNGNLEPTSLVAAQGRQVTPDVLRYAISQAQPPQGATDENGVLQMGPQNVVPEVNMPAGLASTVVTQRGKVAGDNSKPSELKKLTEERDALAQDSPLRPTYDAAIKSKEGRNIDSDTRIWEAMFPGEAILAKSGQPITPDAIQRAAQNGYRISPNMTRAQALETALSQYSEKIARANATGRVDATLNAPAKADETSNLFDRDAFINDGKLVQAKGPISEREARGKLHITDKNLDQLTAVDQAGEAMQSVHDMGRKLFKAKTPAEALVQAGRFYASANPLSRVFVPGSDETVYQDSLAALSNNLAKAFGGERGVLTNVDVTRWTNAMAHPSDTGDIVVKKEALTKKLYDSALRAQRRAIAGDTVLTEKKQISNLLDQLEKIDGQSKQGVGGPAKGDIEDGYRFKGGDKSKPENWEKVQ